MDSRAFFLSPFPLHISVPIPASVPVSISFPSPLLHLFLMIARFHRVHHHHVLDTLLLSVIIVRRVYVETVYRREIAGDFGLRFQKPVHPHARTTCKYRVGQDAARGLMSS